MSIRALIYGVGFYKLAQTIGLPLYHLQHQLTVPEENESALYKVLKGTTVAVTGCTDGIGRGLTLEFTRRGFNTYLLGRNSDKLENVRTEVEALK